MAPWPSDSAPVDAQALEHFDVLQSAVRGVRNARAEYGVTPGKRVAATLVVPSDTALRCELIVAICFGQNAARHPGNAWRQQSLCPEQNSPEVRRLKGARCCQAAGLSDC